MRRSAQNACSALSPRRKIFPKYYYYFYAANTFSPPFWQAFLFHFYFLRGGNFLLADGDRGKCVARRWK